MSEKTTTHSLPQRVADALRVPGAAVAGLREFANQIREEMPQTANRVDACIDALLEQLEAAETRKRELWTRLLDMENKYMDAYQRAADATEQYTRLLNASTPALGRGVYRGGEPPADLPDDWVGA